MQHLKKYIATIVIIVIAFIIQKVVSYVKIDKKLIPIINRFFKLVIWIVALLLILPLYGINISALIATLGVGSLAIALAAQDTIANIISGFMIIIDAPFRVGDKIKLPSGENVEVLYIGVRRSRFLSEDKAIIIVPNLDLSKSKIINYTYGEERSSKEKP